MEAHSFYNYTFFCNPFLDYAIMHYTLLTTLMNVTNGEYLGLILQRVYLIDSNSDLKQKQKMQIILVGYIRTLDNKVINENYIFVPKAFSFFLLYLISVLLHFMSNICVSEQELTSNALEKLEEYKSIAKASLDLPSFTCL